MCPIKILITCIHYPVASGRYIADAFRRLGHDVRTIGQSTGKEIWGLYVDEKYIWESTGIDNDWSADLWIHADSAYHILGRGDAPRILWGVDNHCRDYAGRDYDAMFFAHSWGARMSEPNAYWLPCAYDPVWFHDDGKERRLDVAFIGYPYEARQEIVVKMKEHGLDVYCGIGALYAEYNEIYNCAKIALVKSACGDLAQRFFENMAQGCCVLTDYTPDAIKLGFEPCKDFWLYNGPDEAAQSAKWLIASGEWKRIALSGREKVKDHTWDNRARQLLQVMEMSQ